MHQLHRAVGQLSAPGLVFLLTPLLLGWNGDLQAADLRSCRLLRDTRDQLVTSAMEQEIALVRRFRSRICPRLAAQAEVANANDGQYAPMDYASWSRCRLEAERQLEKTFAPRFRNAKGFMFYTERGADLAEQADRLTKQFTPLGCP